MKEACPHCDGTGLKLDQASIGKELRELRERAGMKQSFMATLLGVSPAYLSDLERGNRSWHTGLIRDYKQQAITRLPNRRKK